MAVMEKYTPRSIRKIESNNSYLSLFGSAGVGGREIGFTRCLLLLAGCN